MSISIKKINSFRIIRPLLYKFTTSFTTREFISHVIIDMESTDEKGNCIKSLGEATTHSEPYYNGEFDLTVLSYYKRLFKKILSKKTFESPEDFQNYISEIKYNKQNRFAIAAIDIAINDAFAQIENLPLCKYLNDHYKYSDIEPLYEINVGVSRGMKNTPEELASSVDEFIKNGSKKIKLKIAPNKDVSFINAVLKKINFDKNIYLSADANSSYNEFDTSHVSIVHQIARLVNLLEQPFSFDDIWNHALLVKYLIENNIECKLCLDESIRSLKDILNLISQIEKATNKNIQSIAKYIAINIKVSRVGGLTEAMNIANYCKVNNISIMPGGMHEFDIGQAAVVAFSSLDDSFYPGDTEGSETYYNGSFTIKDGLQFDGLKTNTNRKLTVPRGAGLGIGSINYKLLKEVKKDVYIVKNDMWNEDLLKKALEE